MMKFRGGTQDALICWGDAFGWDAVYGKPGGPIKSRPLVGWALVASPRPGRKSPTLAVYGVLSAIGNQYVLAGRGPKFLGYARAGEDLDARFGKAGRRRKP